MSEPSAAPKADVDTSNDNQSRSAQQQKPQQQEKGRSTVAAEPSTTSDAKSDSTTTKPTEADANTNSANSTPPASARPRGNSSASNSPKPPRKKGGNASPKPPGGGSGGGGGGGGGRGPKSPSTRGSDSVASVSEEVSTPSGAASSRPPATPTDNKVDGNSSQGSAEQVKSTEVGVVSSEGTSGSDAKSDQNQPRSSPQSPQTGRRGGGAGRPGGERSANSSRGEESARGRRSDRKQNRAHPVPSSPAEQTLTEPTGTSSGSAPSASVQETADSSAASRADSATKVVDDSQGKADASETGLDSIREKPASQSQESSENGSAKKTQNTKAHRAAPPARAARGEKAGEKNSGTNVSKEPSPTPHPDKESTLTTETSQNTKAVQADSTAEGSPSSSAPSKSSKKLKLLPKKKKKHDDDEVSTASVGSGKDADGVAVEGQTSSKDGSQNPVSADETVAKSSAAVDGGAETKKDDSNNNANNASTEDSSSATGPKSKARRNGPQQPKHDSPEGATASGAPAAKSRPFQNRKDDASSGPRNNRQAQQNMAESSTPHQGAHDSKKTDSADTKSGAPKKDRNQKGNDHTKQPNPTPATVESSSTQDKIDQDSWGEPPAEVGGWGDSQGQSSDWNSSSTDTVQEGRGDPPSRSGSGNWGERKLGYSHSPSNSDWNRRGGRHRDPYPSRNNPHQGFADNYHGRGGSVRGRGGGERFGSGLHQGFHRGGGRRFQDQTDESHRDARSSLDARNTRLSHQRGYRPDTSRASVEETPAGNAGTAVVNRGPVNALSEDTAAEAKSSGKMDTSEEGQQESSPSKEAGSDVRSGYRQKKERFGQRPGGFSGQNGVNDRQPDGDSSGVHHRNYPAARNRYEGPGQKYQRNKEHRETTRLYNAHPMFSNSLECQMTWEDMDLAPGVISRIAKAGLKNPSNVQKLVMKPFMQGLDVVAQSQSQYDRTCTLAIALLQKLSSSASTHKHCQALIVCSDKVSPQTVYNDFQSWFDAAPGLEAVLLSSDKEAARVVLSDPNQAKQVVLGTLGPLMEALRGDLLNLGDVKTVVISMHSDELVKFDAFKELLGLLPQGAQLVLMTGRITPPIQLIKTQNFRSNTAVRRADELTLQWSEHYFIDIPLSDQGTLQRQHHQKTNHHRDENEKKIETEPSSKDHKWDVLMEILTKNPDISHTVILTLTYSQTEALTSKLKAQQFNVVSVWSLADKSEVALQFNKPEPCILVSEWVLMEGLDLDFSSLVVNYEMPKRPQHYIFSFGPFGRSGQRTLMINLCVTGDSSQKEMLQEIKSLYDINIEEMKWD